MAPQTITKPIITIVNDTNQPKKISISTYAYSYDYPKTLTTVPANGQVRIAVNSKEEIPQYLWYIPPFEGKASFLIDPSKEKINI
jgi:hypothetical protein